ncbi:MAG: hypothetical protein FIA95_16320 [Gemmatimonadetes bacterium]|nr:hypothetical protein [Gemmatimonadota bacterium]
MRIHFYGVQGSGSIFPSQRESDDLRDLLDYELLKRVTGDVARHIGPDNRLDCALEDIFGGGVDRKSLLRYRNGLDIPEPRVYGGLTTCVHVETRGGHDIVLDCGSGFRNCAQDLQAKWGDRKERHLHILGSHSHYDHTEGFDQAVVCFDPRNTLHIYANYQFLYALDSYLGIFSRYVPEDRLGVQSPLNYKLMPCRFEGFEIRDSRLVSPPAGGQDMPRRVLERGEPIEIGDARVTPLEVFHPAPCLAYKIECGGRTFVFATDHELRHGSDPTDPKQIASERMEADLVELSRGADLLYRDGQYLRSEYDGFSGIGSSGPIPRLDWGHSCVEDVQEMAAECGIARTLIGHHDPNREWSERNWIDESLARFSESQEGSLELARAGNVIDL